MENKELYYTPKIEDIRIGYQCEIKEYHSNPFTSYIFSESDFAWGDSESSETDFNIYTKDDMLRIRTPYLTKEDIESFGWKMENILHEDDNGEDLFSTGFVKDIIAGTDDEDIWYEILMLENNMLFIQKKWYRNSVTQLCREVYYGKCLSINEFKYITEELLNIK